jgi:hypothetical protein
MYTLEVWIVRCVGTFYGCHFSYGGLFLIAIGVAIYLWIECLCLRYCVEVGLCFFVAASVTSLWMCSYLSVLAWWRIRAFMDEMVVTLVLVTSILMENMEHLDFRMVHVAYEVYYPNV